MRKGMGGHQYSRSKTDTWLAPKPLLDCLGVFDLDPCAAPLPRPWDTARRHYTAPEQDGLALPWEGRVWLNPPYGNKAQRWLARLSRHGVGTALIFARTETKAFQDLVYGQADAVLYLRARLADLYAFLENHPRSRRVPHWREKIRQTVGRLGLRRIALGQYEMAA